jgi:hypothetical protein
MPHQKGDLISLASRQHGLPGPAEQLEAAVGVEELDEGLALGRVPIPSVLLQLEARHGLEPSRLCLGVDGEALALDV